MRNKRGKDAVNKFSLIHPEYFTKDGRPAPGVTTVLNELNKPWLTYWAWDLGKQGIDYRRHVDHLARVGTLAHRFILDYYRDQKTDTREYSAVEIKMARNSLLKFFTWENSHEVKPIWLEKSIVSEQFIYGGTFDFYGSVDGELNVVDFKTAKNIYEEHFYQAAAYYQAIEEKRRKIQAMRILQIGRDDNEGFSEKVRRGRPIHEFNIFLAALTVYNAKKALSAQRAAAPRTRKQKA
jgi:hypothetical protein